MVEIKNYEIHKRKTKYFEFEEIRHEVKPLTVIAYCNILAEEYQEPDDFLEAFCPSLLKLEADDMQKTILVFAVRQILYGADEKKKEKKPQRKDEKITIDLSFFIADVMNFYSMGYEEVMSLEYAVFMELYTHIRNVTLKRKLHWSDMLFHIMPADSKKRGENLGNKLKSLEKRIDKFFSIKKTGKKARDIIKNL